MESCLQSEASFAGIPGKKVARVQRKAGRALPACETLRRPGSLPSTDDKTEGIHNNTLQTCEGAAADRPESSGLKL